LTQILKFQCLPLCSISDSNPSRSARPGAAAELMKPHPYYFRETLSLPQLTSGPKQPELGAGLERVDLFDGGLHCGGRNSIPKLPRSLRTELATTTSRIGPPDGKSGRPMFPTRKDAMELWLLNLTTGKSSQLTSGGAVNVEPRWSPRRKKDRPGFSTQCNRRFHVPSIADVNKRRAGKYGAAHRRNKEFPAPPTTTAPTTWKSIPVWTRDGKEILFISNRGHIHGNRRLLADESGTWAPKRAKFITKKTSWKAHPDFHPDGLEA